MLEELKKYSICDECLGRVFLNVEGRSNKERGAKARRMLGLPEYKGGCYFCGGIFDRLDELAKKAVERVKGINFRTFRVGTILTDELRKREERLWEIVGIEHAETLKKNINRELGKKIRELTGKRFSDRPNIEIIFDTRTEDFTVNRLPVFIYGRYRKLSPMPQSKWPCRYCGGAGCPMCNFTGRQWRETVEYYMADVALGMFLGRETAIHAMGREDIDARMLGSGRPFVLEIKGPLNYIVDFKLLEEEINKHARGKIEVIGLRWSSKREARELKAAKPKKLYLAVVKCEDMNVNFERLRELVGVKIRQRTPTRILHRKGEKERIRKVYDLKWTVVNDKLLLVILAESGLYIKELVSGDNGRTRPSVSEILGTKCVCEHLDVLEVFD